MAIEGDARFLSHHDTMRAVERAAVRAALPLRYSQGFNPRPVLSLTCPRNVGIASQDDLLVLSLDEEIDEQALIERLGSQLPRGMRVTGCRTLSPGQNPQVQAIVYRLRLCQGRLGAIKQRLEQLETMPTWTVLREKPASRGRSVVTTELDLRPLVRYELDGEELTITLTVQAGRQARPAEALSLAGLDDRLDLAELVRTHVDYGIE